MTTITEILAEAFNRIKTEHGVTLSRVDFDSSGRVEFSASSNPQVVGIVKRQQPQGVDWARRDVVSGAPERATHVGSIQGGAVKFWRYEDHTLYFHDFGSWMKLAAHCDAPHNHLVDELTPLPPVPAGGGPA